MNALMVDLAGSPGKEGADDARTARRSLVRCSVAAALGLLFVAMSQAARASADAAWSALKSGGHVLIVRHAQTVPGIGDPPGFRVDDCARSATSPTRGASPGAARWAERLRAAGVRSTRCCRSAWCRCLDTAALAFGSRAPYAPLNSFFDSRATEPRQTAALRERVRASRARNARAGHPSGQHHRADRRGAGDGGGAGARARAAPRASPSSAASPSEPPGRRPAWRRRATVAAPIARFGPGRRRAGTMGPSPRAAPRHARPRTRPR